MTFSRTARLAAAYAKLFEIPHGHQKMMHEEHMISLVEAHHCTRRAEGGSDHFSNCELMLIADHRERTRKIDVPGIAKGKRITRKHAEHRARRAIGAERTEPPRKRKRQWPSRKIPSRPFRRAT